jgi:hypothetical protein
VIVRPVGGKHVGGATIDKVKSTKFPYGDGPHEVFAPINDDDVRTL